MLNVFAKKESLHREVPYPMGYTRKQLIIVPFRGFEVSIVEREIL